jgi:hypothetical protein
VPWGVELWCSRVRDNIRARLVVSRRMCMARATRALLTWASRFRLSHHDIVRFQFFQSGVYVGHANYDEKSCLDLSSIYRRHSNGTRCALPLGTLTPRCVELKRYSKPW